MLSYGVLALCLLLSAHETACQSKNKTAADYLQKWEDDTSLTLWPNHANPEGGKVNVTVSMYVINLEELDVEYENLAFSCFLRVSWTDPRLNYSDSIGEIRPKVDHFKSIVWIPDVFIANARRVEQHTTLQPDIGILLHPNGSVLMSSRMRFDLVCPMELTRFPFDKQKCHMVLESYIHNRGQMKLSWKPPGVQFNRQIRRSSFSLDSVSTTMDISHLIIKDLQRLVVEFSLSRSHGHYILYWYVPCVVMAILGYMQLWLPEEALSAKSTIASSIFLSFFILMVTARVDVPKVGYITAIDQWFMVHLLFLMVFLLEVIVLHILGQMGRKRLTARFEMMQEPEGDSDTSDHHRVLQTTPVTPLEKIARKVIWFLKFILPAAYCLFVAIYWGIQAH